MQHTFYRFPVHILFLKASQYISRSTIDRCTFDGFIIPDYQNVHFSGRRKKNKMCWAGILRFIQGMYSKQYEINNFITIFQMISTKTHRSLHLFITSANCDIKILYACVVKHAPILHLVLESKR